MSKITAAVVQVGSCLFDTPGTLKKTREWCAKAAESNPQLVVFPEAFIGGYPKGLDFGARVGSRSEQGRDDFQRYWDGALDVPGKETLIISEVAAKHRINLVIGVIE